MRRGWRAARGRRSRDAPGVSWALVDSILDSKTKTRIQYTNAPRPSFRVRRGGRAGPTIVPMRSGPQVSAPVGDSNPDSTKNTYFRVENNSAEPPGLPRRARHPRQAPT